LTPIAATKEAGSGQAAGRRTDTAILVAIAAAMAILHIATNGRYGFHRDELQFLSDARHVDWGFVAYPPFTPFIERISMALFGLSLIGLRLFSVLAQAIVICVAGLMARDLGGGRFAQVTTTLAVALSPLPIFEATEFQYTSFAVLWWILVCWFTIRLLKTENPRWWLAIGTAIGLGLLTKYSIVFFIAGLLAGLILSRARRHFLTPWFWAGVAIALLIFLPNLVWLIRHDFISYRFLQHIHQRDVGEGRADGYWKLQFLYDVNLFALPLAAAGLAAFWRSSRYRMLFWMFVIPVLAFWIGKGRFYYVAEAYPVLIAMGAAVAVHWLGSREAWVRRTLAAVFFVGLFATGAYSLAVLVPIVNSGPLRDFALKRNGDLREEIGWDELVRTVARIRDSLPPDQQKSLGITVGNYGEAGAIEVLGAAYHLPRPISTTNSAWYWSYPTYPPGTLIVLGLTRAQADAVFTGCWLAGHNGNSQGVVNEESKYHPDIFVCGPPKLPWPELWKKYQSFG
jgi:4-amino-4-deoxy-L-arabinose transferase-like glycosyltransferase